MSTDYSSMDIAEVYRLLGERIKEFESRGLNYGTIGPLHPRTMLALLDVMLTIDAQRRTT
jgi:hypothetical protein